MKKKISKRVLQIIIQFIMIAAILFISSGRMDWGMAWAYLGIFVVGVCVNMIILMRRNPELIEERSQIKANTKKWDLYLAGLFGLLNVMILLVSGLDIRFGWTNQIPFLLQFTAIMLVVFGAFLGSWAIISNPFFASTVRIQFERGHRVVSNGPYQYIRHPGYGGWILSGIALPVMLGSFWAFIASGLTVLILIIRTGMEDQTLRRELPGYEKYSQDTRFRLVPYVW